MTSPVETITPDTSLADAARMMRDLGIGLLPVANVVLVKPRFKFPAR
jgi:CBS domain-containing protein